MRDVIHFENTKYIQRKILSVLKILIIISSTEIISNDHIIFIGIFKRCCANIYNNPITKGVNNNI